MNITGCYNLRPSKGDEMNIEDYLSDEEIKVIVCREYNIKYGATIEY